MNTYHFYFINVTNKFNQIIIINIFNIILFNKFVIIRNLFEKKLINKLFR